MARLDTQRRVSRLHQRANARKYVRGYDANPHECWGDSYNSGGANPFPATDGYAGIPGSFGPPGCTLPATAAAVIGSSIVATPKTAWTTGQFVQTATAGAAGRVCWTGTGWVSGAAP